jgi:hypothetical protein
MLSIAQNNLGRTDRQIWCRVVQGYTFCKCKLAIHPCHLTMYVFLVCVNYKIIGGLHGRWEHLYGLCDSVTRLCVSEWDACARMSRHLESLLFSAVILYKLFSLSDTFFRRKLLHVFYLFYTFLSKIWGVCSGVALGWCTILTGNFLSSVSWIVRPWRWQYYSPSDHC